MGLLVILASPLAGADVEWRPPPPVQQRISDAVEMLERIQAMVPAPIEDVESLADQLDYDIEAAIGYVRNDVRFEPYLGVLRGPDGAAVTAAGNAWDQALLLAALLKTMGADAQVVAGTITEDDARRLLLQAFNPVSRDTVTFDAQAVAETVSAFDSRLAESLTQRIAGWKAGSSSSSLDENAAAISGTLQSLLERADVELPAPKSAEDLIKALSADYAWVRWRDGPGSEWSDLHPAFAGATAPHVAPGKYFDDEVPREYQHRVAIRLWIERSNGAESKTERVPIMDSFERPTAQLFKQTLALGLAPVSGGEDGSRTLLLPFLNDGLAPGAQAVSELGLTVSADVAGANAAKIFETVSAKAAGGLGALSQLGGGPKIEPRLTSVVLTIERSAPGGEPVTVERRLVDLRQSENAAFPDSAVFELLFETDVGAPNQALTTHRVLAQGKALLQAVPAFHAFARGSLSDQQLWENAHVHSLDRSAWFDWDILYTASLPDPAPRVMAFRPSPMLSSLRRIADADAGPITIVDIYTNPVAVLRRDDSGAVTIDAGSAVKQGVRDTLLESHLLPVTTTWSDRRPKRLVVDAAGLAADRTASNWSSAAREVAISDLESGYVLAIVDQQEPHWWRVNAATGETLGMGLYGGSNAMEYAGFLVTGIGAVLSAYSLKQSTKTCDAIYADDREMADCCIVGSVLTTYGFAGVNAYTGTVGGMAGYFAARYLQAPYRAVTGYLFTALSMNIAVSKARAFVLQKPKEWACSTYLGR